MQITTYHCDCCMKIIDKWLDVVIPVLNEDIRSDNYDRNHPYKPMKMMLCNECSVKIMDKYYEIAKEHGSTGIIIRDDKLNNI